MKLIRLFRTFLGSITWPHYTPSAGSIWTAPNAVQHIGQSTGQEGRCTGQTWNQGVDLNPVNILSDMANCSLPNVTCLRRA